MNNKYVPYILALIAVLLWGSSPVVSKIASSSLNFAQILFFTTLFATIIIGILMFAFKKQNKIKEYKNHITLLGIMGLIGPFLGALFFFLALRYVTSIEVSILGAVWPLLLIILSLFVLKIKPNLKIYIGSFIGFIGLIIVVTQGNLSLLSISSPVGYLLAFMISISWAVFYVLNKKENFDPLSSMFIMYCFATVFSFIVLVASNSLYLPTIREFGILAYIGIFPGGLAFVLWLSSIEMGDMNKISSIGYLIPFMTIIISLIVLKEKIVLIQIIGLLIIIIGMIIQDMGKNKIENRPKEKNIINKPKKRSIIKQKHKIKNPKRKLKIKKKKK